VLSATTYICCTRIPNSNFVEDFPIRRFHNPLYSREWVKLSQWLLLNSQFLLFFSPFISHILSLLVFCLYERQDKKMPNLHFCFCYLYFDVKSGRKLMTLSAMHSWDGKSNEKKGKWLMDLKYLCGFLPYFSRFCNTKIFTSLNFAIRQFVQLSFLS